MKMLVVLSAVLAFPAHAADHWCGQPREHPLDAVYARALEQSGGVTVAMHDAQTMAFDAWDAELNRLYRGAVRQFGRDARADTLRAAQRAWLAWDAAETRSDLAQQADGGSIGPVTVSNLAMQRRRARACTLFNMQDEP